VARDTTLKALPVNARLSPSLCNDVGRSHPSHGSGRTSWWNINDGPPSENRTKRKPGMVPASKRGVHLDGASSKHFVLLPPSRSPAVASSHDHLHPSSKLPHSVVKSGVFQFLPHRRKQPQQRQAPVKGVALAAPPRSVRRAHPKWPLPGISLLQRRHSPVICPSAKNGNPRRAHDAAVFFLSQIFLRLKAMRASFFDLPTVRLGT
jgi:hypothetical protein